MVLFLNSIFRMRLPDANARLLLELAGSHEIESPNHRLTRKCKTGPHLGLPTCSLALGNSRETGARGTRGRSSRALVRTWRCARIKFRTGTRRDANYTCTRPSFRNGGNEALMTIAVNRRSPPRRRRRDRKVSSEISPAKRARTRSGRFIFDARV